MMLIRVVVSSCVNDQVIKSGSNIRNVKNIKNIMSIRKVDIGKYPKVSSLPSVDIIDLSQERTLHK